jgi:hypothetical protein
MNANPALRTGLLSLGRCGTTPDKYPFSLCRMRGGETATKRRIPPIPLLRVRALVRKVTHVHRPCFCAGKTGLRGGFS